MSGPVILLRWPTFTLPLPLIVSKDSTRGRQPSLKWFRHARGGHQLSLHCSAVCMLKQAGDCNNTRANLSSDQSPYHPHQLTGLHSLIFSIAWFERKILTCTYSRVQWRLCGQGRWTFQRTPERESLDLTTLAETLSIRLFPLRLFGRPEGETQEVARGKGILTGVDKMTWKSPRLCFFYPRPRQTASQKYFHLSTTESVFVEIDLFSFIRRRLDFCFCSLLHPSLQFFISREDFIAVEATNGGALLHLPFILFVFSCLAHTIHKQAWMSSPSALYFCSSKRCFHESHEYLCKTDPIFTSQTGTAQMFSHTYRELLRLRIVDSSERGEKNTRLVADFHTLLVWAQPFKSTNLWWDTH